MILCVETATDLCSVALCDTGGTVVLRESDKGRSHASVLTVFIEEILKKTGIRTGDLDAVAVSKGPGSYTGLRIGVSVAKGIAYASSIPLIGIDTTYSMFRGFSDSAKDKYNIKSTDLFCPALDARRMELYYSVYNARGNVITAIKAEIMDNKSFSEYPESSRIFLFGNGAGKCSGVVNRKNVIFVTDFRMSASYMRKPAYEAFNSRRFEDVAYFEPFYLKDFITSKPVKNILGK
jgi:tRNA threonylcarbamoyladenosine biosynthesis protein TsaB